MRSQSQGLMGVNALLQQIQRFGYVRLGVMALVTLGLLGFFAATMIRASQDSMALLYNDLTAEDSSAIIKELDTKSVKYELQNDGRSIYVPKDLIARLRIDLAASGIPSGGVVGYEIFDRTDSFSATSFLQNINHLRALEGELARSISTISSVKAARVHLAIPERKLFERDQQTPQASVVLKLKSEIQPSQIQAVRHLIASAIEGLDPSSISVIDDKGRLLASNSKGEMNSQYLIDERQAAIEKKLKTQVEDIVSQIVGPGRVRAQISAELDMNKIQQTAETFDPESKVTRSTQNRSENSATTETNDGTVSVANQLPGGQNSDATQKDMSNKNEEIVNYEISKTTRTELTESGRIKRISAAVVIDGVYNKDASGNVTYQPRSKEEIDQIIALVKSGIGFDAKRGDQVEVSNIKFAELPGANFETEAEPWYKLPNLDLNKTLELAALLIMAALVTLFVGRPLARALGKPDAISIGQGQNANEFEQIGSNPVERVSALISTKPQASVATIRQWLREPTGGA